MTPDPDRLALLDLEALARRSCYFDRYMDEAVDAADDGHPLPLPPMPVQRHLLRPPPKPETVRVRKRDIERDRARRKARREQLKGERAAEAGAREEAA